MNKGTKKILDEWKDEDAMSALHIAVDQSNINLTNFLISKHAELNAVDKTSCTPLLLAASKGHLQICKILLDQKKIDVNICNIDSTSALHYLARISPQGCLELHLLEEVLGMMLRRKVAVDAKNKTGETPLHQAARVGNDDVIGFLYKHNANINEQNKNGETALHYAAILGRDSTVSKLLSCGADKNLKTKSEETALDICRRDNRTNITELIQSYTATDRHSKREEKTRLQMLRKYERLVSVISEVQFFANTLSFLVDKADYDRLAKALIQVSVPLGTTVPLIRGLIQVEFERSSTAEAASVLRGNCPASKVMGIFSRRIGQEYMSKCVGAVVRDLVFNDKLDFELDPLKLSGEENVEAVVERNKEALISHAKSLLRRITSDDKTENMPREIRATAGFIAEYARKYTPDREAALVGGFIMLRLLNPSLVAPESYGMLPWGKVPSMKARRNLILLTKLLQNLSNGIEFGVKEQHMKVVNSFIIENKDLINNWFTSITTDPVSYTHLTLPTTPYV
eukprot:TRINITY_DN6109_c0_g1_i2.p1 TRINITY_DN6109_c0_g1~~TRINITY_DN6109_c0_g1_i2.p1  ORF type:complete len:566 (-),score=58.06 TRINITY_DN6109_c0_g1_i2:11-1549(-)